jgi:ATPase subunit of ABC transporter with duplicated ATPase domains
MMQGYGVEFQDVSFAYETASAPLVEELTCRFPVGWTGIVGANGVGKTTVLKLATGGLRPGAGQVRIPGSAFYCEQRTDAVPDMFEDMIEATDRDACRIRGRLGIEDDWLDRWETLSYGERKRGQIATVLWRRPSVLAVDEPTNHLDMEARGLLAQALASFEGVGMLVSHDRELLDSNCRQCLFMDPPVAVIRRGNFTKGFQEAKKNEEHLFRKREQAKLDRKQLEREATKRKHTASQADRKRSKRGLDKGDHDAREKINRARVSGKDGVAGKLYSQLQGRIQQARDKQDGIKVKKKYEMGIWLPGSLSKRDLLFKLQGGSITLGGNRKLTYPNITMRPDDCIAVTGPNGTGKSTLVRLISQKLNIPDERVVYVPQEIDLTSAKDVLTRARGLPADKLGLTMTVVSRLGSRPDRLLESTEPSPGETRKLLLAMGIARAPHLIIMDEPTNHMDLPSIECLEDALEDCPCGMLLVSHDKRFLARLTRTRWRISRDQEEAPHYILRETR